MILKTLAFFLVMYFLIKLISRMFLPASTRKNARIIFRTFRNMQKHQKQQQRNRGGQGNRSGTSEDDRLEEIEEAEFEDVTDDSVGQSDRKE